MRYARCVFACLVLSSCTSTERLAHVLNDRQITSCVWITGGGNPWIATRAVIATGGADLKECMQR